MSTIAEKVIRAVGFTAAGWLVVGALLYVFEANTGNWLVGGVLDVARWLAGPFRSIFEVEENKAQIIFNWGIGAAVYAVVAILLAVAVNRLAARRGGGSVSEA